MQIKLLTISFAVFLISSSVNATGSSQGMVEGLTTDSALVDSTLQLAEGHVGGLRRRKVNDLANGPRYGFPATEKKATKRSLINTLLTPENAQKIAPQGQFNRYRGDEEEDDDDEEHGSRHEAKRALKARRRLLARADIKGLAIKTEMGANGLLSSSQKLVADDQLAVNKMVGQVEHIADGAATSLLKQQSKKVDDSKSDTTATVAPATTSDKKSTTGDASTTTTGTDSFKKADTDDNNTNTATPKQSAPGTASQVDDGKLSSSSSSSSTGSTEAADNMKVDPQYLGSASDNTPYDNPSNYNGNYFA